MTSKQQAGAAGSVNEQGSSDSGIAKAGSGSLPAKMQRGMLLLAALNPLRKSLHSLTRVVVCPGW
jgi:hypothetical protein